MSKRKQCIPLKATTWNISKTCELKNKTHKNQSSLCHQKNMGIAFIVNVYVSVFSEVNINMYVHSDV